MDEMKQNCDQFLLFFHLCTACIFFSTLMVPSPVVFQCGRAGDCRGARGGGDTRSVGGLVGTSPRGRKSRDSRSWPQRPVPDSRPQKQPGEWSATCWYTGNFLVFAFFITDLEFITLIITSNNLTCMIYVWWVHGEYQTGPKRKDYETTGGVTSYQSYPYTCYL